MWIKRVLNNIADWYQVNVSILSKCIIRKNREAGNKNGKLSSSLGNFSHRWLAVVAFISNDATHHWFHHSEVR